MTQIHVSFNRLYDGEQWLLFIIIGVRNDTYRMENHENSKDYLSNTDVDAQLNYFVNSNNGEILEDELNYQTSKKNSTKTTSTI